MNEILLGRLRKKAVETASCCGEGFSILMQFYGRSQQQLPFVCLSVSLRVSVYIRLHVAFKEPQATDAAVAAAGSMTQFSSPIAASRVAHNSQLWQQSCVAVAAPTSDQTTWRNNDLSQSVACDVRQRGIDADTDYFPLRFVAFLPSI